MIHRVARGVRRLPYGDEAIAATRTRLPAPAKRVLRRARARVALRSPRSMMTRIVTPGMQNRLLGDPRVVERLLETPRAVEMLSFAAPPADHGVDWVGQVALNDPVGVVDKLQELAVVDPQVDAAIDRLVAARPSVLAEEQIIDVFLSLDEFERHRYWTNDRVKGAFLDFLSHPDNAERTSAELVAHLDKVTVRSQVRFVTESAEVDECTALPAVAADIMLGFDDAVLDELWTIENFRSAFVDNLLADEDLYHLRTLLRSDRLDRSDVRQALFDALSGSQPLQIMSKQDEVIVLPSADAGFAKAFWSDRVNELSRLERFLSLRSNGSGAGRRCFVDVGANLATHTIHALASDQFDSALLVEPDPRLLPILKANVALNRLDGVVSVAEVAAGERSGTATLWCSEENWGDNRLSEVLGDGWFEVNVPVKTVDQIVADHGIDPAAVGALWIDVQGHEREVLSGAREVVSSGCDIAVEFWPAVLDGEGRLEATVDQLLSMSDRWVDLESGDSIDQAGFRGLCQLGIEAGESYYADLALIRQAPRSAL